MNEKEVVRISKFLSLVLRHKPDVLAVALDKNGWTEVNVLLQRLNETGHNLTLEELQHVVETNNKKHFAFDETGTKIRASQGHSVNVDLGYPPVSPPDVLYHGTSEHGLPMILENGLDKRQRRHVHLYADATSAKRVGQRHGKPGVLKIDAKRMHDDGLLFYVSANGVWLTDRVPPKYIAVLRDPRVRIRRTI